MNQETLEVVLKLRNQLTPDIQKGAAASKVSFDKITAGANQALSAVDRLATSMAPGSKLNAGVLKYAQGLDAAAAAEKSVTVEADNLTDAVKKSETATKGQNKQLLKSIITFGKFALGIGAAAVTLNALKNKMKEVITASIELGVEQAELEGKTFAYKDATDKLTESHQAWLASIGDFLTRNPQVVAALNVLADLFLDLADANITARDEMGDLVGIGFVNLVEGSLQVARAINGVIRILNLANQTVLRLGIGFNNAAIAVDNFFGVTTPQFILDITPALEAALADTEAFLAAVDAGTDAIIAAQEALGNITAGGGAPTGRDITDRGGAGAASAAIAATSGLTIEERKLEGAMTALLERTRQNKEAIFAEMQARQALLEAIKDEEIVRREGKIDAVAAHQIGLIRSGFGKDKPSLTAAELSKQQIKALGFDTRADYEASLKGAPLFGPEMLEGLAAQAIGGGGVGGLLPVIGSAFGPIGTAIGGALAGIFGKKKRGMTRANPVFTEEVKKGDMALALLNIFKGQGAQAGGRTINDINNLLRGGGATLGFSSA